MNIRMPLTRGVPGMGKRAYAYAKACGIIGKSFVGERIRRLENVSRLSELDRLVFPSSSRDLPERELLLDLEERITGRAVNSIISIVGCFSNPPELLTLLVRAYEYADLKSAVISSREREEAAPAHTDIGRFQTVRFDAWPDLRAMIGGTGFDFLLDKKGNPEEDPGHVSLQTALDRHYYNALWKSLLSLPRKDRYAAEKILSDEISLRNSGWALRLRAYYQMDADEVRRHLIDIPLSRPGRGSLADEAFRCLEFPLDSFAAWASWHWKGFLNPEGAPVRLPGGGGAGRGLPESGGHWQADPRYFQNAASRHLAYLSKHYFRLHPFSLDTVFCFIKLKQFEEDILTSEAEGLSMGISGRDVFAMLGVEP